MSKSFVNKWLALLVCGVFIAPLLNGCTPASVYAVRDVVRAASGNKNAAQNEDETLAKPRVLGSGSYRTYAAHIRSLPLPKASQTQISQLQEFQDRANQWASLTLTGAAKPVQSGAGIIIGEPTISSTRSSELANFGAGCARWLHLNVGGQGALGKTPLWGTVADTRDELRKTDCRWTKTDLPLVAQGTGATHIALGTIAGTANNCTLNYQLWDTKTRKPFGAPIIAKGTRAQIVAQLPKMAQITGARLNSSTRLSPVEISADDLQFLGSVPWKAVDKLVVEQETRLRALSKKSALAGILWIYNGARDSDEKIIWKEVTASIARLAPQNTLAIATIARRSVENFAPYSPSLTAARRKFPNNYALIAADWQWTTHFWGAARSRDLAFKGIAASSKNSLAWSELGDNFANEAQEIRSGKYISQMSGNELSQVTMLYPQQIMAGLQAARVNPLSDSAWLQVCKGAAFDGESEIADAAFWKAMSLNPNQYDTYWWGLQLYQPKWQGDSIKLHQVAFLLARNPLLHARLIDEIYYAFKNSDGSENMLHFIAIESVEALQAASKKQPRNVAYHRELCEMLRKKSRLGESVNEYSIWMKLQPDNIIPVVNLGNMYFSTLHDNANAEKMYQKAVAMQPNNAITLLKLAALSKDTLRNFDKAAPLYRRAMKADPQNEVAISGLANCYWFLKNDEKTGGKLFLQAINSPSNSGSANADYAWALMSHGNRAQATIQAKKALAMGLTDHEVFKSLGLKTD